VSRSEFLTVDLLAREAIAADVSMAVHVGTDVHTAQLMSSTAAGLVMRAVSSVVGRTAVTEICEMVVTGIPVVVTDLQV
jgi:hypothetical protein